MTVIQPSVLKGETDGISLLTQYNPHGIFIWLVLIASGFLMAVVFRRSMASQDIATAK